MENFVSLILKEYIDIYNCNSKYSKLPCSMEYWDVEMHIDSDNNELMLEKYVSKIRKVFRECDAIDLHYIIRPFCMTNFCEYLSEKISGITLDLQLKKVIISPKGDKYKFIWESR